MPATNNTLYHAITTHNINAVQHCLEAGEDPNQIFPIPTAIDNSLHQPTTPLHLVLFCISDSMLEEADLADFASITKLLLEYGADPKPALEIAEVRYGKYDPNAKGGFMDVLHLISNSQ